MNTSANRYLKISTQESFPMEFSDFHPPWGFLFYQMFVLRSGLFPEKGPEIYPGVQQQDGHDETGGVGGLLETRLQPSGSKPVDNHDNAGRGKDQTKGRFFHWVQWMRIIAPNVGKKQVLPGRFRIFPGKIGDKQEKYRVKSLIINAKMTKRPMEFLFLYDQTI